MITTFCDIHIFEASSTIVIVNSTPFHGPVPIVTWLTVSDNQPYSDPTWLTVFAETLGKPSTADVVYTRHGRNGERFGWTNSEPRRVRV